MTLRRSNTIKTEFNRIKINWSSQTCTSSSERVWSASTALTMLEGLKKTSKSLLENMFVLPKHQAAVTFRSYQWLTAHPLKSSVLLCWGGLKLFLLWRRFMQNNWKLFMLLKPLLFMKGAPVFQPPFPPNSWCSCREVQTHRMNCRLTADMQSQLFDFIPAAVLSFLHRWTRAEFGLAESEACLLQGAGQRRLRRLVVEKEGCEGVLFSEMEEVLVCAERQLPVLVHKRGGTCPAFMWPFPPSMMAKAFAKPSSFNFRLKKLVVQI